MSVCLRAKGQFFVPHRARTEGHALLLSPLMLSPMSSARQGRLVTTFTPVTPQIPSP